MLSDAFGKPVKSSREFPNAGKVCKEYFTPIDRWIVVHDTDTADKKALLGILKPHPEDEAVMRSALDQITEIASESNGIVRLYKEQYAIDTISGDPGLRQHILIQNADLEMLLKAMSSQQWKYNPYSEKTHEMVERCLNLPALSASARMDNQTVSPSLHNGLNQ